MVGPNGPHPAHAPGSPGFCARQPLQQTQTGSLWQGTKLWQQLVLEQATQALSPGSTVQPPPEELLLLEEEEEDDDDEALLVEDDEEEALDEEEEDELDEVPEDDELEDDAPLDEDEDEAAPPAPPPPEPELELELEVELLEEPTPPAPPKRSVVPALPQPPPIAVMTRARPPRSRGASCLRIEGTSAARSGPRACVARSGERVRSRKSMPARRARVPP